MEIEACDLHDTTLVWDNHGCLPLRADDDFLSELNRYRNAGVNVVSINVSFDLVSFETGIKVLSAFRAWIKSHADEYALATSVKEIKQNHQMGRLSILFDIEGLASINESLDLIDLYYDLGVRWALLAYNRSNQLAGGCMDNDGGLTALGRSVVQRMAKVGMVTCCSHMGWRTAMDVIDCAENPVIFSHSNAAAIYPQNRNIADSLIKTCAEKGGVIGVNGVGIFLGHNEARVDALCRHIVHIAELVGVEHVGIGLDYMFDEEEIAEFFNSNRDIFPVDEYGEKLDLIQIEKFPAITERLLLTGFSDSEVAKIMGGNWMRVAEEVWR